MLKHRDCEECKYLFSMGVDDNLINRFHEDKAKLSELPKVAQKLLKKWREKKGYASNGKEAWRSEASGD